jgi:hypothetical protein
VLVQLPAGAKGRLLERAAVVNTPLRSILALGCLLILSAVLTGCRVNVKNELAIHDSNHVDHLVSIRLDQGLQTLLATQGGPDKMFLNLKNNGYAESEETDDDGNTTYTFRKTYSADSPNQTLGWVEIAADADTPNVRLDVYSGFFRNSYHLHGTIPALKERLTNSTDSETGSAPLTPDVARSLISASFAFSTSVGGIDTSNGQLNGNNVAWRVSFDNPTQIEATATEWNTSHIVASLGAAFLVLILLTVLALRARSQRALRLQPARVDAYAARFCDQCGTSLPASAAFCPRCGVSQSADRL